MSPGRSPRWVAAVLGVTALVTLSALGVAALEATLSWTGDSQGRLGLVEAQRPPLVLPRAEPRSRSHGDAPALPVPVVNSARPAATAAAALPAVSPTPTPEQRAGAEFSAPPAASVKARGTARTVIDVDALGGRGDGQALRDLAADQAARVHAAPAAPPAAPTPAAPEQAAEPQAAEPAAADAAPGPAADAAVDAAPAPVLAPPAGAP